MAVQLTIDGREVPPAAAHERHETQALFDAPATIRGQLAMPAATSLVGPRAFPVGTRVREAGWPNSPGGIVVGHSEVDDWTFVKWEHCGAAMSYPPDRLRAER